MATGRSNKLVGQTGEYLIASDEAGRHVSVQVKASRSTSWQFGNITQYCDITFDGQRQVVGDVKPCPVLRLIVAFVKIEVDGNDRFYILPWERLRDLLVAHYKAFLTKHDGRRPNKWDSLHCAIEEKTLQPYKDQWATIEKNLK